MKLNRRKEKVTLNFFGLTRGSSFGITITDNSDYFMRWLNYKNNPIIIKLINNDEIIKILCKDFSMCFNFNDNKIKICKNWLNI